MITIGSEAQNHFRKLLQQQGSDTLGVRLTVVRPGTPAADCQLSFCEETDLAGDEWVVECEGFNLYVVQGSAPFLDGAEIDMQKNAAGMQLTIRAPNIKGRAPGAEAGVVERVRYVLESEVAPQLAAHGGRVQLVEIDADGVVVLKFGGGCHGCGMVEATVRDGIERTLKSRIPEVTAVRDATDHSTGKDPYVRRHQHA